MRGALEVKVRIATREGGGRNGSEAENRRAKRDSESDCAEVGPAHRDLIDGGVPCR